MIRRKHGKQALLALLVMAGGLTACSAALAPQEEADPGLDITVPRTGDSVASSAEGDVTYLDVRSDRGIGEAMIARGRAAWPRKIALRFHLAGLEALRISYGDTSLALSVTTSGRILQSASSGGAREVQTAVGEPYWMDVAVEQKDGADKLFIVGLPADFYAQAPQSFDFGWIDFYR